LIFSKLFKKNTIIEDRMSNATSYSKWHAAATEFDDLSEAKQWKQVEGTNLYDHTQIRHRLNNLRLHRAKGDNQCLLFALNEGLHGNMGGMGTNNLYGIAKLGTKQLIEDYVDEIVMSLQHIASLDNEEISDTHKLDFFRRASACFGRTALMLSGGGALGHFHVGVVKALLEQDLLPDVISGSSAGSMVTAMFGTHTNLELHELIKPARLLSEVKKERGWLEKVLYGRSSKAEISDFEELVLNRLVPDLTFQEAYELTGRKINITIAPAELHQTSRLLNAITSPNVYIRKAVLASCAVPGVYPSVMLEAKNVAGERQAYLPTRRWVDGSLSDDLPAKRLARLYGVNYYIASMINPIVLFTKDGWEHTRVPSLVRELSHRAAARSSRVISAFSKRYTRNWTKFNVWNSMIASVLNQEYSANINVYPNFHTFDFRKILSPLTEVELLELVRQGELATWVQMERIRNNTKVSRTIDRILSELEALNFAH